mmetsp:Transcript_13278/g.27234  ORF Transcript_13278/g.27234 Transcript_13278/m.27234 type:complete len:227 (+) Transcript_13278:185-865(+)
MLSRLALRTSTRSFPLSRSYSTTLASRSWYNPWSSSSSSSSSSSESSESSSLSSSLLTSVSLTSVSLTSLSSPAASAAAAVAVTVENLAVGSTFRRFAGGEEEELELEEESESESESEPSSSSAFLFFLLSAFALLFSSLPLFSVLPPVMATPRPHCFTVLSPAVKNDLPSAAIEMPVTHPLCAVLLFHTVLLLAKSQTLTSPSIPPVMKGQRWPRAAALHATAST